MSIVFAPPKAFTIAENWSSAVGSYDRQIQAPDRFAIDSDAGGFHAVFSCQPGDMLSGGGERAEIVLGGWSNTRDWHLNGCETSVEYYKLAVRLESPWVRPEVNLNGFRWGMFFQIHGPNYFINSPALALHAEDDFKLFLLGGDMTSPGLAGGGFVPLTGNNLVIDAWVEFVVEAKWSTAPDGYAILYRRDAGESGFRRLGGAMGRRTLQWKPPESGHPHYMKCGFYRSASAHTNTVRIRPILRTTSPTLAFA